MSQNNPVEWQPKLKERDPRRPLPWPGRCSSGIHGLTMVIISDYEREYNRKKDIFNQEQWRSDLSSVWKQTREEGLGESDQQEDRRRKGATPDREAKVHQQELRQDTQTSAGHMHSAQALWGGRHRGRSRRNPGWRRPVWRELPLWVHPSEVESLDEGVQAECGRTDQISGIPHSGPARSVPLIPSHDVCSFCSAVYFFVSCSFRGIPPTSEGPWRADKNAGLERREGNLNAIWVSEIRVFTLMLASGEIDHLGVRTFSWTIYQSMSATD